jgi:hypothetical protein
MKPHANKKMVTLFKFITIFYKLKCIGLTLLNLWNYLFFFWNKSLGFPHCEFGVLGLKV